MRRLLVYAVIGLLLGTGLITLIEQDPGYVFVSLGEITVETSFWFALLLFLVLWAAAAVLVRLLARLLRTRRSLSGWLGGRKMRNAAALTNRGLINFIEGNWERARRQLLRSARYSEAPLVNHLIAAQASFRLGDLDETRRQLGIAESVEADAGIALELTQAELQLSAGRYEQALATLVRARANASKHPYVLELLARAHRQLGDWSSLRELLPELRRHGLLEAPSLTGVEQELWQQLLSSPNYPSGSDELDQQWQGIPLSQRESGELRRIYVRRLIEGQAWAKAERMLVDMLDKHWDSALVAYLGTFEPINQKKLLKTLRRWLDQHGHDAALLHAAGRVALYAQDWDQAQTWLQAAYQVDPSAAICLELARLRAAQGDTAVAQELITEAARRAVGPLPETPLPSQN